MGFCTGNFACDVPFRELDQLILDVSLMDFQEYNFYVLMESLCLFNAALRMFIVWSNHGVEFIR